MRDGHGRGAEVAHLPVRAPEPVTVPFLDLGAIAREVWPSIQDQYIEAVLTGKYIGGPAVETFERDWADYCGTRHAVGVANGTDAILLTLEALGIGVGDDVILPANTFIATAEAIVRAGATPRFADVDPHTLLITPDTLTEALTPHTRAVIAVHLYGQTPNMDQLVETANQHGIHLIEDAAQAHGAEWKGQRAGSFGTTGCFSFYPGKNLGAFGDAGAVTTNNPDLAATIRALANHGRAGGSAHYQHQHLGTNSRLDALQALVLSAKLTRNETWTENRIAIAKNYRARLDGTAAQLIGLAPEARHVYHLLVARVPNRDRIQAMLAAQNIQTGVHYPLPCHQQPPFRRYADRPLPVCEQSAAELLSLPIYPHLTSAQLDHVCRSLETALDTALSSALNSGEVLTDVRAG